MFTTSTQTDYALVAGQALPDGVRNVSFCKRAWWPYNGHKPDWLVSTSRSGALQHAKLLCELHLRVLANHHVTQPRTYEAEGVRPQPGRQTTRLAFYLREGSPQLPLKWLGWSRAFRHSLLLNLRLFFFLLGLEGVQCFLPVLQAGTCYVERLLLHTLQHEPFQARSCGC